LVLALVAGAAAPGSAHTILLRTDPSPQTTVTRPPAQVRLEFSEPVEVAFGAVRVFVGDGIFTSIGSLRRCPGLPSTARSWPPRAKGVFDVAAPRSA
jgi:methionine-rich copper-binding protein CopC